MLRVGVVCPTWIGERHLKSYLRVPNVEAVAFAGEANQNRGDVEDDDCKATDH
jgi:hypothetical protein